MAYIKPSFSFQDHLVSSIMGELRNEVLYLLIRGGGHVIFVISRPMRCIIIILLLNGAFSKFSPRECHSLN